MMMPAASSQKNMIPTEMQYCQAFTTPNVLHLIVLGYWIHHHRFTFVSMLAWFGWDKLTNQTKRISETSESIQSTRKCFFKKMVKLKNIRVLTVRAESASNNQGPILKVDSDKKSEKC